MLLAAVAAPLSDTGPAGRFETATPSQGSPRRDAAALVRSPAAPCGCRVARWDMWRWRHPIRAVVGTPARTGAGGVVDDEAVGCCNGGYGSELAVGVGGWVVD